MVFDSGSGTANDFQQIMELFQSLSATDDKDDKRWINFSSFFMTVNTNMEVSFNNAHHQSTDLGILKNLIGDIPDHIKEKQRETS